MNSHRAFVLIVGIVDGISISAVNLYFLIQKHESAAFMMLFMIPVVIVCFAIGFLIAEIVWKIGIKCGLIDMKR